MRVGRPATFCPPGRGALKEELIMSDENVRDVVFAVMEALVEIAKKSSDPEDSAFVRRLLVFALSPVEEQAAYMRRVVKIYAFTETKASKKGAGLDRCGSGLDSVRLARPSHKLLEFRKKGTRTQ
jgi:hypothetical protein